MAKVQYMPRISSSPPPIFPEQKPPKERFCKIDLGSFGTFISTIAALFEENKPKDSIDLTSPRRPSPTGSSAGFSSTCLKNAATRI